MPPKSNNSGIRQLSNGDAVIPSSVRPDGSVRKEIRVKPGYKPPEDVEVYKNRTAEAWKNRGKGGVPGAQVAGALEKEQTGTAVANKNAKRREARRRAAAAETGQAHGEDGQVNADGTDGKLNGMVAEDKTGDLDPETERAREARKLAKKLRQARDLQDKKEKGDELLPEQLAKAIRLNELIHQLDGLGFDADGEKKVPDGD